MPIFNNTFYDPARAFQMEQIRRQQEVQRLQREQEEEDRRNAALGIPPINRQGTETPPPYVPPEVIRDTRNTNAGPLAIPEGSTGRTGVFNGGRPDMIYTPTLPPNSPNGGPSQNTYTGGGNNYANLPTNAPPGGFYDATKLPGYADRVAERDRNLGAAPTPWNAQGYTAPAELNGISDSDLFQLYAYGNPASQEAVKRKLASRFSNQNDLNSWLNSYGPGGQNQMFGGGDFNTMQNLFKKYGFGGNTSPTPAPVTPPGGGGVNPPSAGGGPLTPPQPGNEGTNRTIGTNPLIGPTFQPPVGSSAFQTPLFNPPVGTGGNTTGQGFKPVNVGAMGLGTFGR